MEDVFGWSALSGCRVVTLDAMLLAAETVGLCFITLGESRINERPTSQVDRRGDRVGIGQECISSVP